MQKSRDWPFIWMWVLTAVLLIIPIHATIYHYRMLYFVDHGTQVSGRVESVSIEQVSVGKNNSRPEMFVFYRFFDSKNIPHINKSWYSDDTSETLKQGDPLSITYLQTDPERNLPSVVASHNAKSDGLWIIWLFLGLAGFSWALFFRERRKAAQ